MSAASMDERPARRQLPLWLKALGAALVPIVMIAGLVAFIGQFSNSLTSAVAIGAAWFVAVYIGLRFLSRDGWGVGRWLQLSFAVSTVVILAVFGWTSLRDKTVNETVAVGVPASALVAEPAEAAPAAETAPATAPAQAEPAPSPTQPAEAAAAPDASPAEAGQGASAERQDSNAAAAPGPAAEAPAPTPQNVQLASGEFAGIPSNGYDGSGQAAIVALADGGNVLTITDLDTSNGPDLRVYLVDGPVESDGDVTNFVDLGGLKGNKGNQQYEIPPDVDPTQYETVVIWCRAFSGAFAAASLMPS